MSKESTFGTSLCVVLELVASERLVRKSEEEFGLPTSIKSTSAELLTKFWFNSRQIVGGNSVKSQWLVWRKLLLARMLKQLKGNELPYMA